MNRQQIEKKTAAVIERQQYQRGYATVEDSLILTGWLEEEYLTHWKKGQVPYLEKVCGTNLSKLSYFMKQYFAYAARKGYKLSLTFSKSGNASIERRYSTRIIASYKKKPPLDKINDKEALKK